jgi:hypothetical protein
MLKDNIKAVIGCESFEGSNNILVLKLSVYMQRLRGRLSYKCSYIDELNRRGLSNSHFYKATEFNIVNLLELLL